MTSTAQAAPVKQSTTLWQRIFQTQADDRLPHTLTHRRLYILPTYRGWMFFLALLLILVASINYALSLGYALSFLMSGLFASTLFNTYRNMAGLHVLAIDAEPVCAGQPVIFNVRLHNPLRQARHGIRITASNGCSEHTALEAATESVARLSISTTRRGRLQPGRMTLHSDWPLGLWTCWSYLHTPCSAMVYPAPEQNAPALPSMAGQSDEGRQPRSATQGEVSGLRDYVPGDAISAIAWKTAARGQGLHVRTFEADNDSLHTQLTLHSTGLIDIEPQLSRLCAWVLHAQSSHQPYTLLLSGSSLDASLGADQHRQALQALALYPHTA